MTSARIVIGEFAVNPACIRSTSDLSTLLRIFGFPNGAVISEFPRGWIADIKASAQHLEEPARSSFLSKVDRLKEKALVRMGRTAEGVAWLDRALSSHAMKPFSGILHCERGNGYMSFQDAMQDEEFPAGFREAKVLRDADSIIRSIRPLVQSSERFSLIDPYFEPDEYHGKFVRRLVQCNRELRHRRLYIDIHREWEHSRLGDVGREVVASFGEWVRCLPDALTVTVRWWDDCGTGELHPRYMITERGGVRLDRGFKIPPNMDQQESDTDVAAMKDEFVREIESRYIETYRPLKCLKKVEFKND